MSHLRAVVLSVQLLIYLVTFRPFGSVILDEINNTYCRESTKNTQCDEASHRCDITSNKVVSAHCLEGIYSNLKDDNLTTLLQI